MTADQLMRRHLMKAYFAIPPDNDNLSTLMSRIYDLSVTILYLAIRPLGPTNKGGTSYE